MLEEMYEDAKKRPSNNPMVRQATLMSLKRLMNQLYEEIVRFEAHQTTSR